MKLHSIFACALAAVGTAQFATAGTRLPIDHPTPPPCAADGSCYPKTGEWGWYQGRWRQWPGVALEPTPSNRGPGPTPAAGGSELGPSEPPSAEQEDVQAPPPSSTKKKPAATESGDKPAAEKSENTTFPGLPPLPPYQSTPATPSGPAAPKTSTTGDLDPPPELPYAISPAGKTAPTTNRGANTSGPRLNAQGATSTNDPPPSPPWSFRSAAL
jgi:hypothetical protein